MFTGSISRAGALVTAIVALIGGAILRVGAAAADPSQDEQFLALLAKEDIPAQANLSTLITTAHAVCHRLDGGVPVGDVVDEMRNYAFSVNPMARLFDQNRVTRTMDRFITAAVEAYCPVDQGKIASITANPVAGPNEPMHRLTPYIHNVVNTGSGIVLASLVGAVPSGEIAPPNPPIPPPPTVQTRTPPRPIAAPPPPKQTPPPPQQPPPPPQQVEPPAVAPQPGGAAGSGGGGSTGTGGNSGDGTGGGGGGPVQPSPTRPMSPGWVKLAP